MLLQPLQIPFDISVLEHVPAGKARQMTLYFISFFF